MAGVGGIHGGLRRRLREARTVCSPFVRGSGAFPESTGRGCSPAPEDDGGDDDEQIKMGARQANTAHFVGIGRTIFDQPSFGESSFFSVQLRARERTECCRARDKRFWRSGGGAGLMDTHGAIDCGDNRLRETLQHSAVVLTEGVGLRGKNFEQANHSFAAAYGSGEHGANAEGAATLAIYALVGFGIIAAQHSSGAHAFSGKTRTHLQSCAHGRSAGAGAGAADHGAGIFWPARAMAAPEARSRDCEREATKERTASRSEPRDSASRCTAEAAVSVSV